MKKIRVAHGGPICMLNEFSTSACNVHACAMCMQHILMCMHESIFGNSSQPKQNLWVVMQIKVASGGPICMLNDFCTSSCDVHVCACKMC